MKRKEQLRKPKNCRECQKEFTPYNSLQKYCSYQCAKSDTKGLSKKPRKPIKAISKQRAKDLPKYIKIREEFLSKPENQVCPITGKPTTDIHHKKGKIGKLFLDTNFWIALSREGHKYVEEHPEWAKEKGYSLNRLN